MNASTDTLPKSIVDKILMQAEIDALLSPLEKEENRFDPLSLKPIPRFDESKFIDGVKKLQSASIPAKKAYKDKFISEVTMIGYKNGKVDGLCLTNEPYIKVEIPGVHGEYYIETNRLRRLLVEFGTAGYEVAYEDGCALVKLLCIDRQLLLDQCEVK